MFFTKEDQTLYPASWEYNAILIIDELRQVIENNGGVIKPHTWDRYGFIVNRTLHTAIREKRDRITQIESAIKSDANKYTAARTKYLAELKKEVAELETINNDPVRTLGSIYVGFRLDNMYYSVSFDDNPFFPFHYVKTPIQGDKISRDACSEELNKNDWLYDCFLSYDCSAADRREAANLIFNQIINAPRSEIIRDKTRRRVANTYNAGYHYETVYAPERFETIDF